jgi:DNA invertase Pin-like site-specific DNA recombinase
MKMPRAYSYLRFSTPEQSKGDSFRRQTELSRDYAKRHGLELDESLTFRDLGVSAFRGKNAQEGALGVFLNAVETGKIRKGSYLLVENLDRLSRDTVRSAFIQFTGILERGVNVVTLTDGKLYTAAKMDADFGDLLISLTTMFRAHEESALKSKRLSASWKNKRAKAQADGKKLTARCPAWLTLNRERTAFVVDKDREKVVRRIFDMALAGSGKSVIERRFNSEKVPTFGKSKGWQGSYIQKILENEAVCGVFQPMRIEVKGGKKSRVPDGDPIPDYFPVVIPRATFERARRARASRRIPAGRKGESYTNLFTGLMLCGNCGAPLHHVNKGEGPKGGAYLSCSNARRAVSNCKAPSWKYRPVESLLIAALEELNYNELFPEIASSSRAALKALEDTKLEKDSELARTRKQLDSITELLIARPNQPTLLARLDTAQATVDNLTVTLRTLESQIEEERERAKTAESDFRQVQDGLERLDTAHATRGPDLFDLRSRLHQLLRRTIQEIKLFPANGSVFSPERASEYQGAIAIRFQATNIGRTLYVGKGFSACQSIPIRNGKADFKKAVTLRV